jgi:hypothetical protein
LVKSQDDIIILVIGDFRQTMEMSLTRAIDTAEAPLTIKG